MKKRLRTTASEDSELSIKKDFIRNVRNAVIVFKGSNEKIDFATVLVNESSNKVFYVHLTSSKNRIPSIHDHGYFHALFDTAAT